MLGIFHGFRGPNKDFTISDFISAPLPREPNLQQVSCRMTSTVGPLPIPGLPPQLSSGRAGVGHVHLVPPRDPVLLSSTRFLFCVFVSSPDDFLCVSPSSPTTGVSSVGSWPLSLVPPSVPALGWTQQDLGKDWPVMGSFEVRSGIEDQI